MMNRRFGICSLSGWSILFLVAWMALPCIQAQEAKPAGASKPAGSGKPAAGDPAEGGLGIHGFAHSGGTKIHYVTKGTGPLVVMIHGFPDYWYTWRKQIPALAENHQVVAMDQRGYNWSDQPEGVESYAMSHLVDDVLAVVKHFERDQAIIVGHDWGGMVAWQFAMRYPEATSKLIILNLPHPNGLSRELASNPEQQKNSAYARFFQTAEASKLVKVDTLVGWVKDPDAKEKYLDALKRSSMEGMLNYYKANYPREPYTAPTDPGPRVKCSVLMFHGLKDKALLSDALNGTWQWLDRDLTLVTIPDADHFVQQDAADQVTKTMVRWLQP
jgi:pimeloyl-ACP methyl ester carboxylesterase